MIKSILDKRIPTLLGISLIAFSVILLSISIRSKTGFISTAITSDEPKNITITNISDTSFTISYITDENLTGTINYGKDPSVGTFEIEDLDREKSVVTPRIIHSTTLNKLTPNTKYFFVINSGQTTYLNNNAAFEIQTPQAISSTFPKQNPITGKVIVPNTNIPSVTIAYLTIKGAQTLSTLVKPDGLFIFDLDSLRSEDLSTFYTVDKDANIKITFVNDFFTSRVLSTYSESNPLPTITLSNNYDFTLDDKTPSSTKSGRIGGFGAFSPDAITSTPIPKKIATVFTANPSPTNFPSSTPTNTPIPSPDLTYVNQISQTGDKNVMFFAILALLITSAGIILFLLTASRKSL